MENKLLKYFSRIMPLSKEEIEAIDKTMHFQQFKKGTILLKAEQISADVYFVLEGSFAKMFEAVQPIFPATINAFGTYTIPNTPSGI